MPHSPRSGGALDGKDQGVPSIDAVDGIDNRHESCLPVMLRQRKIPKQIRLDNALRGDFFPECLGAHDALFGWSFGFQRQIGDASPALGRGGPDR